MPSNTPSHLFAARKETKGGEIVNVHVPWKELGLLTGFKMDYLRHIGIRGLYEPTHMERESLYMVAKASGRVQTQIAFKTSFGRAILKIQVQYSDGLYRVCSTPLRAEAAIQDAVANF